MVDNPTSQMVAHNKILSEAQELAICQYLDFLDRGGPKAQHKQLKQAANALLKKDHIGRSKPKNWVALGRLIFTKTPSIFCTKTKPVATEQKNAHHQPITIQPHFHNF